MTTSRRRFLGQGAGALGIAALGARAFGAEPAPAIDPLMARGVEFLRSRQKDDGSWSPQAGPALAPGLTGVALAALLRSRRVTPEEPVIAKGLDYLGKSLGPKGGFAEGPQANYVTAVALMAFHEANVKGRYDAIVRDAQAFLKGNQWDEGEGKAPADVFYGGAGYGRSSRPDLSNTSFFVDALRETGIPADDPSMKKALVFVSRCQNLKGEFNDQPWAGKVDDGGFIYTAAGGGVSVAGGKPEEGLRSYASMTYAGLKSMVHAGLTPDDPRVKAALKFARAHYTVEENPGLGQAGIFYYYQAFAKALSLLGDAAFVDDKGVSHDWRSDLVAALAKLQKPDGAWVNPEARFMEGDASLATSFGLLALAYTRPGK